MTIQRRRFLYGTGLAIAAGRLSAQSSKPAWADRLSPAVMQGVAVAARKVYGNNQSSTAFRNLATAAGIFFNHLQEIGATAEVEQRMKTSPTFLLQPPTHAQIAWSHSLAERFAGVQIAPIGRTEARLQSDWHQLKAAFDAGATLHSMTMQYVADMNSFADALDRHRGILEPADWICDTLYIMSGYIAVWSWMATFSGVEYAELAALMASDPVLAFIAAFGLLTWAYSSIFC